MGKNIAQNDEDYSIYRLVDPRDLLVHYIGISRQPYVRYGKHLTRADNNVAKNAWILEMTEQGQLPLIEIIETVKGVSNAKQREAHWITVYLGLGMPLTNVQQCPSLNYHEAPASSQLECISFALETLQTMSAQLNKQIAQLQEEVANMKIRDEARISSIHRAYARTADRALKRRRKSIKLQKTISEKIVYQLKRLEPSTAREIALLVHLDVQTVREELQTLIASGMVEEARVGKTFRYRYIVAS